MKKFLWLLLLWTTTAIAQNHYYVSPSGSDSNDGSQAHPWATIQKCANSFVVGSSGAVCHVASGSYNAGTVTISRGGNSNSARVLFISDTKWGAKITGRFSVSNGVNYLDIEQFDITGPSLNYAILLGSGTSRSVQYNYIHDIQTSGSCPLNGVIHETTAPSSNDVFNGNVMRHMGNVASCGGGSGYMAMYLDGSGIRITNNIISGLTGGWAIQKQYASITDCTPGVIANNTLFNNQGGIVLNDEGNGCALDHWTIINNIVVNNGISGTGGGSSAFGINYYHMASAPNTLVSNNMVYGNLPANYAIHGSTCTGGTAGCPATNPQTDASTSVTFTAFQSDTNASPTSNYNYLNYQLGGSSNAINNGTRTCASGGLSNCAPNTDVQQTAFGTPTDIGAFSSGAAPPPTNATLTPSSLDFGSVAVGVQSNPATFTLTTSSSGSITISSIATSSSLFPITGKTCGTSLAASSSCTISVACKPQAAGAISGTLTANDSASNSPQSSSLNCTGVSTPTAPAGLTVVVK